MLTDSSPLIWIHMLKWSVGNYLLSIIYNRTMHYTDQDQCYVKFPYCTYLIYIPINVQKN